MMHYPEISGDRLLQAELVETDKTLDDLAVLEEDQGGDRIDAITGGQIHVLVGIDLDDLDGLGVIWRELLHERGDPAARTAPRGPEIDQHRLCRAENFAFETGLGKFLGCFPWKRGSSAVSAKDGSQPTNSPTGKPMDSLHYKACLRSDNRGCRGPQS